MLTKKTIVETIVTMLVFLFLYTGISKFIEFPVFQAVLESSPMLGKISPVIAWLLPASEIALSLILIIPKTRLLGLYSSSILLLLFTVYLVIMVKFYTNLPCSCGGVISKLSWSQHIYFNIAFLLLSLLGVKLQRDETRESKVNARAVLH